MEELIQRLTANGFAELEGLQVAGTLPVRQDLINDALATLLQNAQARNSGQATGAAQPDASAPAPKPAAPAVNWFRLVNKLQVRLQEGKAVVDFELRR